MKTVLFMGGGTLGPVTPLIATSEVLRSLHPDWRYIWVGTPDGPERKIVDAVMPYEALPAVKLRRYLSLKTLQDIIRFPGVLRAADRILKKYAPDVAIGAGGFVSVPVGFRAKRRSSRLLIHQQDVRPSLTNRLLTPFADRITVTFPASCHDFPMARTKVTGNPVRTSIRESQPSRGRNELEIDQDTPLVVALGGGTGASGINALLDHAWKFLNPDCVLFHLSGLGRGLPDLKTPRYIRRKFVTARLGDILAAADIVVTRAGMGTLSELSYLRKPTVIIPIPKSHQEDNARCLATREAALVLDQSSLTPKSLATSLNELLEHPERRKQLGEKMGGWNPRDAALRVADEVLALVT